jgi:hypothetical protein
MADLRFAQAEGRFIDRGAYNIIVPGNSATCCSPGPDIVRIGEVKFAGENNRYI